MVEALSPYDVRLEDKSSIRSRLVEIHHLEECLSHNLSLFSQILEGVDLREQHTLFSVRVSFPQVETADRLIMCSIYDHFPILGFNEQRIEIIGVDPAGDHGETCVKHLPGGEFDFEPVFDFVSPTSGVGGVWICGVIDHYEVSVN